MQSGFGADDSYNAYDKPLFADRGSHLFKASRATADDDEDAGGAAAGGDAGPRTERFKPDKGFQVSGRCGWGVLSCGMACWCCCRGGCCLFGWVC